MLYTIDVFIEVQDSYGLRKFLHDNGFRIYRFDPKTCRSQEYREDYSSDTEKFPPDFYNKNEFQAFYSNGHSFPKQEVFKELNENPKVKKFIFTKTSIL